MRAQKGNASVYRMLGGLLGGLLFFAMPARVTLADNLADIAAKVSAAEGGVIITLQEDYLDASEDYSIRTMLTNDKDAQIIIDGQGHAVSGMLLGNGRFTFRNCRIIPLAPKDVDMESCGLPGIEMDNAIGRQRICLENTVILNTGADDGCASIKIKLSGVTRPEEEKNPPRVRTEEEKRNQRTGVWFHNDAHIEGSGVAVGYWLMDRCALQIAISGECTNQYAFFWMNWGDEEAKKENQEDILALYFEQGVAPQVEPQRSVVYGHRVSPAKTSFFGRKVIEPETIEPIMKNIRLFSLVKSD